MNKRKFNIKLGDTYLIRNFDVVSIVGNKFKSKYLGPYAAYDEYIPITVSDEGVYYKVLFIYKDK